MESSGHPEAPYGARLEELLGALELHMETMKQCGAENFLLRINVGYDEQCNLEFSPQELTRLSRINVPLAVTCYLKANNS